jgi:3-hydroxybutyryl-CoA dehydrogenase
MSTAATPQAEPAGFGHADARAAVIGAGLMGHGIAQVLAVAGVHVLIHDPDRTVLDSVPRRVAESLEALGHDADVSGRIALAPSLREAVAEAAWVFEAAPEKLRLKQEIFRQLDEAAPAGAVLATNTSVISIRDIASQARGRNRIIGTHWWNPPTLVPLVEVVQTTETDVSVVARTMSFLRALGKTPVHVKRDVAGFVGNRLQHALWREAFNLLDDGVCDAETIDIVVKAGFGLRLPILGPMENADLIGLDLTLDIHDYILPRLHPPSEPSPGLRRRVEDGRLGMKTGAGLLEWTPEQAAAVRERLRAYLLGVTRQAGAP